MRPMIVPGDIRQVCVDWMCIINEHELTALFTGDTVCIIAVNIAVDSTYYVRAISATHMYEVRINVSARAVDVLFGAQ